MSQAQVRHAANRAHQMPDAAMEARHRYKGHYMRRWRSDPRHFEREMLTRLRAELKRRLQPVNGVRRLYVTRRGKALCGSCRQRPPVKMQERLRISEAARDGYVKVLIPCCGDC
jgi:hypothetical protein